MAIAGGLLVLLNVVRASVASLTHDEAGTFIYGVLPGLRPLLEFRYVDANNHILNSLLMNFTYRFFGTSEWVLRLPNLVAHAAYVFITWRMIERWGSRGKLTGFLLLNIPLLLYGYFAMARGYGLAMCFSALGLSVLLGYVADRAVWRLYTSQCLTLLAAAANFSFLVVFVACWAVTLGLYLWTTHLAGPPRMWNRRDVAGLAGGLGFQLGVGMFLLGPLLKLRAAGSFYFGGTEGFVHDTVFSLLYGAIGWSSSADTIIASHITPGPAYSVLLAAIVLVAAMGLMIRDMCRASSGIQKQGMVVITVFLVLSVCVVIALHWCLGMRYPVERAAIYFYLLAGLAMAMSPSLYFLRLLLVTIILLGWAAHFDLKSYTYREKDRDIKPAIRLVEEDARTRGEAIRLATDWWLAPGVRYYQGESDAPFEFMADRTGYPGNRAYYEENKAWYDAGGRRPLRHDFNYAFVLERNVEVLGRHYATDVLAHYPLSKTVVLRLDPRTTMEHN